MTVREYLTFVARSSSGTLTKAERDAARRHRDAQDARRRHGQPALRQALEGLPAARRPGAGAHPRPRGADPRRADRRPRPEADHRDARPDPQPGGRPHDHPSTHILPEVAQTCQRVVIINKGRVVAVDTPENLTHQLKGAATLYVQVEGDGDAADALRRCPAFARSSSRRSARATDRLRDRSRAEPRRPPRRRAGDRRPRLGPARAAADAHEPRGDLPAAHDRRTAGRTARARRRQEAAMARPFATSAPIAGKELRSYFGSPVAWVMMGLFAIIFGYFYIVYLDFFVEQRDAGGSSAAADRRTSTCELIRPLLSNASVLDPVPAADDHDADLLGGEALGHDRAAAHVAGHRLRDHPRQVPRRDRPLRRRCSP